MNLAFEGVLGKRNLEESFKPLGGSSKAMFFGKRESKNGPAATSGRMRRALGFRLAAGCARVAASDGPSPYRHL
jgi:hypothetical protein